MIGKVMDKLSLVNAHEAVFRGQFMGAGSERRDARCVQITSSC